MKNSEINVLDWNSLLLSEDLSEEERQSHLEAISAYKEKRVISSSLESKNIDDTIEINIDDSFLEDKEVELTKISYEEMFDFLRTDSVVIDSNYLFPKFEDINALFWFLHHLSKQKIEGSLVRFTADKELSVKFYQLTEAAVFFRFLDRLEVENKIVFISTKNYEDFLEEENIQGQYKIFLKAIGENQTISEILTIQLNVPVYDRISKQMVHRKLADDTNIRREGLSEDEIDNIVNKLRYWYLGIRKVILES